MSDRIAVFNNGRIEQIGTPAEVYERPAHAVRRRLRRHVEPVHDDGRGAARRVHDRCASASDGLALLAGTGRSRERG